MDAKEIVVKTHVTVSKTKYHVPHCANVPMSVKMLDGSIMIVNVVNRFQVSRIQCLYVTFNVICLMCNVFVQLFMCSV